MKIKLGSLLSLCSLASFSLIADEPKAFETHEQYLQAHYQNELRLEYFYKLGDAADAALASIGQDLANSSLAFVNAHEAFARSMTELDHVLQAIATEGANIQNLRLLSDTMKSANERLVRLESTTTNRHEILEQIPSRLNVVLDKPGNWLDQYKDIPTPSSTAALTAQKERMTTKLKDWDQHKALPIKETLSFLVEEAELSKSFIESAKKTKEAGSAQDYYNKVGQRLDQSQRWMKDMLEAKPFMDILSGEFAKNEHKYLNQANKSILEFRDFAKATSAKIREAAESLGLDVKTTYELAGDLLDKGDERQFELSGDQACQINREQSARIKGLYDLIDLGVMNAEDAHAAMDSYLGAERDAKNALRNKVENFGSSKSAAKQAYQARVEDRVSRLSETISIHQMSSEFRVALQRGQEFINYALSQNDAETSAVILAALKAEALFVSRIPASRRPAELKKLLADFESESAGWERRILGSAEGRESYAKASSLWLNQKFVPTCDAKDSGK